jgi:hypothetical protein
MAIQETFNTGFETVTSQIALAYEEALKDMLIDKGKEASGTLVNSIRTAVRSDGNKFVIEVFAEDYLRFVDKGRAPGKFPPPEAIRSWVAIKGLPEEAAFPIARKIALQGIPATPIVNPSLEKVIQENQEALEQALEQLAGAVLVNDVFSKTNTKGQILPKSLTV